MDHGPDTHKNACVRIDGVWQAVGPYVHLMEQDVCMHGCLCMRLAQLGQALWVCGVSQDFHWALSGKFAYKLVKACKLMLHMHI
jgi:hypothetical protein